MPWNRSFKHLCVNGAQGYMYNGHPQTELSWHQKNAKRLHFSPQNVSLLNAILLRLGEGQLPGAFANKRQKLLNSRLGAVVYMKPKTPFTLGLPVRFSGGLSAL